MLRGLTIFAARFVWLIRLFLTDARQHFLDGQPNGAPSDMTRPDQRLFVGHESATSFPCADPSAAWWRT